MRARALLGLLSVLSASAQALPPRAQDNAENRPTLRVDSNLVLVPVTITDARGAVVADLHAENFKLAEERQPQEIISFSHEIAPVSLGIVVDLSGSMASKIGDVRTAVKALLDNLEPEDEEFLVTFADRPDLKLSFTSDTSAIQNAFFLMVPGGRTALFDAVDLAVRQLRGAANRRRILFLISDGGDNHSRLTERELRRLVDEEDVQIHAIGIHGRAAGPDEARGPWILEDLAKMTGGEHHMVDNSAELPALAARMSLALHERYVLGYRPAPLGTSGTFRRIEVGIIRPKHAPKLFVYARRGYRVP